MRYLSTTEAAAVLHVDPSRVRLLCKLGRIETIKIGGTYGIAEDEVKRLAGMPRRPGRPRRVTNTDNRSALAHDVLPSHQ